MLKLPIYLDNHATTPVDPRVLEAMLPYFREKFGNAASRSHSFGWAGEEAVTIAREQAAAILGADPKEIVFTSGSTESNNIAIKGVAEMYRDKGKHLITVTTEHKAVLDPVKRLESQGYEATYLPVDKHGRITAQQVADAIRPDTILVSVMFANNEVGTIHPIEEIGRICKERGVIFHCDATQAIGKVPVDVNALGIDLLSLSAHKLYGPKGVGLLYVRRRNPRVRVAPLFDGGGHERGVRSGTLNVPGIVGLGKATEIAKAEMDKDRAHTFGLRERLRGRIFEELDYVTLNGDPVHRLPGNLNVSFAYVEGEAMMMGIKDIAVSSGSACTSASLEPSYVLRAMGVGEDAVHTSIRYGIGRFNTREEIDYAAEQTIQAVRRLRELSPLYEMVKDGVDLASVQWKPH
ncbi:MAG TPA: IscS subfamily cysteine desulfurase [Planctomycetota bacterium]|nr:IscS subfamily cysteine desulfurase [Planctomycetota bacterium]